MQPSRAIILAAGIGARMGPLTADRPKAMLEVGGRMLIDRALDALAPFGLVDARLVVGHQHHRLRDHLRTRVRFIENTRYRDTNSLYSLWLARDALVKGALIMNSDVLVSHELVARLIEAPVEDAVLIDTGSTLGNEEMKVKTWQGFAIDFGKELSPQQAAGENVGLLKFGPQGARRLVRHLDALIGAGHLNAWAPLAFRAVAQEWPLHAITTDGLPWTEIDFPEDLDRAQRVIAPGIVDGVSRKRAA
jgi:choline kinase